MDAPLISLIWVNEEGRTLGLNSFYPSPNLRFVKAEIEERGVCGKNSGTEEELV